MITFKQFITESTRLRKQSVLYSSPHSEIPAAVLDKHDAFEELARILHLESFYANQKLHVETYGPVTGPYQLHVKIPIPNGLSGDDLQLFIDLVKQQAGKLFKITGSHFSNADRKSWNSAAEFVSSVDRRKDVKETRSDVMTLYAVVNK